MFVIRYLMAALAAMSGVLVWGNAAGYSGWTIAGLAFLVVLAMQALILAHVVIAAARKGRKPAQEAPKKGPDQLVILPR